MDEFYGDFDCLPFLLDIKLLDLWFCIDYVLEKLWITNFKGIYLFFELVVVIRALMIGNDAWKDSFRLVERDDLLV